MLVDAARGGSAAAFEQLYRAMAGQVSAYLRWHRATDPDGLTNDVFAQVHRNRPVPGRRAGLPVVGVHDRPPPHDRRPPSGQPDAAVEDEAGIEEHMGTGDVEDDALAWLAHDRACDLLAVLSRDQREVLLLRIVADLPVEEVARILDKREGAIKALQHRALNALRRHIDRHPLSA